MKIIATKHRSAGNETVGDMWTETQSFDETATLKEVFEWQKGKGPGNLILTIDQATLTKCAWEK